MRHQYNLVKAVGLPTQSRLTPTYSCADFADAYAVQLPSDATTDPEQLARFILSNQAPWVSMLMKIRDAVVGRFGLKTAAQLSQSDGSPDDRRVAIFKIYDSDQHEILLGEDDSHLDFRMSVLCQNVERTAQAGATVVLSTVVHCHNKLGRNYIRLIAPFHKAIVQSSLRRAARQGWPKPVRR
jgi:hypothetical protein